MQGDGGVVNFIIVVSFILLGIVFYSIYQRQRYYSTERTIQIVSHAVRICFTRSDIRELLYYTDSRERRFYLVRTTDLIYNLGRLEHLSKRQKFLSFMELSTGLSWKHTAQYFRFPSQY